MRHIVILILVLSALGYFVAHGGNFASHSAPSSRLTYANVTSIKTVDLCGVPTPDGKPVKIGMLASREMQPWLDAAVIAFGSICPNIQVQIISMNSFLAVDELLSGRLSPTLWAPENDNMLRYLEHRVRQTKHPRLFAMEERTPLLSSPLVWMMPDSRSRRLKSLLAFAGDSEGMWMQTGCAMVPRSVNGKGSTDLADMLPGTWSAWYAATHPKVPVPKRARQPTPSPSSLEADPLLSEFRVWGRVSFGHADPSRAPVGLDALVLLSYDFVMPPSLRDGLASEIPAQPPNILTQRIMDQGSLLQDWLRRCEAGVPHWAKSDAPLVNALAEMGSDHHDIVAVYEHLAIPVMRRMTHQMPEQLRIVYPEPTAWSTHPVVMLDPDNSQRNVERRAAQKWIAHLLSEEQQNRAIELGFRPGAPRLSAREYRAPTNPFLSLQLWGIDPEITRHEPPPLDGEAIEYLIKLWGQATGHY